MHLLFKGVIIATANQKHVAFIHSLPKNFIVSSEKRTALYIQSKSA